MAPETEPVETIVHASVEPTEAEPAAADDSQEGSEGEGEPEAGAKDPKEQLVRRQPEPETVPVDDLAEVEGETPRERALRLEVTRLKGIARKDRGAELLGTDPLPPPVKKELDPQMVEVLKKYKPEEIQSLREVLPVLAQEMGYVRSQDLSATTYTEKASSELDTFLEKHKEYLPENDKDNLLWGRFQEEYKLYKQPTDPRDFRRIFDKIHKDIFGIKVAGEGKSKVQAAERKVQSASHIGASTPTRAAITQKQKTNTSGLRLDKLQGFTDEELADMTGE